MHKRDKRIRQALQILVSIQKASIFALVFLLAVISTVQSQNAAPRDSLRGPQHQVYRDGEGRLIVSRQMPLFFLLSNKPSPQKTYVVNQDTSGKANVYLREGRNVFKNSSAAGDGRQKDVQFEVWADGRAPQTKPAFNDVFSFENDSVVYYGKNLKISLHSEDKLAGVKKIYYAVNNHNYNPLNEGLLTYDDEGSFVTRYFAVDHVGNRETVKRLDFTIDLSPPITNLKLSNNPEENLLAPGSRLQLQASDSCSGVNRTYYQIDDGEQKVYRDSIEFRQLTDGNHRLKFFSIDNVNNRETLRSFEFYYDCSMPELQIQLSGPVYSGRTETFICDTTRIQISGSDNRSGLSQVQFRINDGSWSSYGKPLQMLDKTGMYRIFARAQDNAGNQSGELSRKIYVDRTPPVTSYRFDGSVYNVEDTSIVTGETQLKLNATDLEAGVKAIQYTINGGKFMKYDKPIQLKSEGIYHLEFFSADHVQNKERKQALTIKVDNGPRLPVVAKNPAKHPKKWILHDSLLTGSTQLPFYVRLSTGPESSAPSFLIDLKNVETSDTKPLYFDRGGNNQLTLSVAGRQYTFEIPIDGAAPKTDAEFLNAPGRRRSKTTFYGKGLVIALRASDERREVKSNIDRTYYSVNGSPFIQYEKPIDLFSREKDYNVRYYSVDKVGNTEPMHETNFTVDLSPPITQMSMEGQHYGQTISRKSEIRLHATDHLSGVKAIYYAFDEEKPRPYRVQLTGSVIAALDNGYHTLTYYAVDYVDNVERKKQIRLNVDNDAPHINLAFWGDAYRTNHQTYISGRTKIQLSALDKANEAKHIYYRIDNDSWRSYQERLASPASGGKHTIRYYTIDQVENASLKRKKTFVTDVTAPQSKLQITGPSFKSDGKHYIGSQTIIKIHSGDNGSGVKSIFYRIDNGRWVSYKEGISITSTGWRRLYFYATDHVNNKEALKSRRFFVDAEKPKINIIARIGDEDRIISENNKTIPPEAFIYLSSTDAQTGINKLTYSINGNRAQLYRTPLTNFVSGDTLDLEIKAFDRVNNSTRKQLRYRISMDHSQ